MYSDILTFTAGSGLLLACFGFLARSIIRHFLDKDLGTFKSELKYEAQKRNLVFQRIYEHKFIAISDLFDSSVVASSSVEYAVDRFGNLESEKISELENNIRTFRERYKSARLWLDDQCCSAIDKLVDEHSIFYKIVNASELGKAGLGKDWVGEKSFQLWERAQAQLPHAQDELRRVFQSSIRDIDS